MGSYAEAAEYYDLIYAQVKDFGAEAERLREIIRGACPAARRVLDVGCGTGVHAEHLAAEGLFVDGLDLEPEFVRIAGARNPAGTFTVGDMTSFTVAEPYDAVLCLFGAIGYARDGAGLAATMERLAAATRSGGVVVVEPWLEPGDVRDGHVTLQSAQAPDLVVCRVSRTTVHENVSRLEFEYLVARSSGIERLSETHELGLFPRGVMIEAFERAGLRVSRDPEGLIGRGLYVATKP